MLAGTLILEDLILQYTLPDRNNGLVRVEVSDSLTGAKATVECAPRAFAASMALALDFDGMDGHPAQAALYAEAETIPFPSRELRWIP